jgi:hypothetical protein
MNQSLKPLTRASSTTGSLVPRLGAGDMAGLRQRFPEGCQNSDRALNRALDAWGSINTISPQIVRSCDVTEFCTPRDPHAPAEFANPYGFITSSLLQTLATQTACESWWTYAVDLSRGRLRRRVSQRPLRGDVSPRRGAQPGRRNRSGRARPLRPAPP